MTVEEAGEITQGFFTPTGQFAQVHGEDVQVFEYDSAESVGQDADMVSEDGSSIDTSMVTWIGTQHFYKSGKLIVLCVGENAEVLDALGSILAE